MDNINDSTVVEEIKSPEGNLLKSISFKNGEIHGEVIIYDESGNIAQKLTYENGTLNGAAEFYQDNVLLMTTVFKNGLMNGLTTLFSNGIKNGEVFFKDGGHFTTFDNLGRIIRDVLYEKGKMNGESYMFFPNGVLQEKSIYKNGLKEGEVVRYYPSGAIQEVSNFVNDKPIGQILTYDENGSIISCKDV